MMAASQTASQEAMEHAMRYWGQMFDLISEMQKRLWVMMEDQMAGVPGVKEARAAMSMMPGPARRAERDRGDAGRRARAATPSVDAEGDGRLHADDAGDEAVAARPEPDVRPVPRFTPRMRSLW